VSESGWRGIEIRLSVRLPDAWCRALPGSKCCLRLRESSQVSRQTVAPRPHHRLCAPATAQSSALGCLGLSPEADRQSPGLSATTGVSAAARRRTISASARGAGPRAVRGVAPVPTPVFGGLAPISCLFYSFRSFTGTITHCSNRARHPVSGVFVFRV
jgi:hypothetical protein